MYHVSQYTMLNIQHIQHFLCVVFKYICISYIPIPIWAWHILSSWILLTWSSSRSCCHAGHHSPESWCCTKCKTAATRQSFWVSPQWKLQPGSATPPCQYGFASPPTRTRIIHAPWKLVRHAWVVHVYFFSVSSTELFVSEISQNFVKLNATQREWNDEVSFYCNDAIRLTDLCTQFIYRQLQTTEKKIAIRWEGKN